jgi:hypothetical protein
MIDPDPQRWLQQPPKFSTITRRQSYISGTAVETLLCILWIAVLRIRIRVRIPNAKGQNDLQSEENSSFEVLDVLFWGMSKLWFRKLQFLIKNM